MTLCDINVLIYAHREDAEKHKKYNAWLNELLGGPSSFAMSDLVFSGFLRIVTHPGAFSKPTPMQKALAFVDDIKSAPHCVMVGPGERHWEIFLRLIQKTGSKGNLIPDAYLAALAIETGCEWITTDRDFSRFPDLKWRHPF